MNKKKVYIGLSLDIIHHGHINLINKAKSYGSLIVGLLSDTAISSQKKLPLLNYSQRKKILSSISGIDKSVSIRFLYCQVVNVLLVSALAGGIWYVIYIINIVLYPFIR